MGEGGTVTALRREAGGGRWQKGFPITALVHPKTPLQKLTLQLSKPNLEVLEQDSDLQLKTESVRPGPGHVGEEEATLAGGGGPGGPGGEGAVHRTVDTAGHLCLSSGL